VWLKYIQVVGEVNIFLIFIVIGYCTVVRCCYF